MALSAHAQDSQKPLKLSDILRQVYTNNPALKAAQEKFEETQELYPQARAGWRPTLNAETSLYSTNVESSNFGAGDGATTKDLSLSVNQHVFRGGRTTAETARANNLIQAGQADLRNAEQKIFLQTMTAYADVIRDREILGFRKNNENILQKELGAVQERHDLGEKTITDVNQARARYSRARSETAGALGGLDASEAGFLEVTGIVPPEEIVETEIDFPFPDRIEDMILMAENMNPEIHAAQHEQLAAEHDVDATFSELLPQVSAFASYNKQLDPQPGIVDKSETQTVGMKATMAFYEGGATRSRVRAAKNAARRGSYEIDETRQRIRQDVTSSWHQYQASKTETESRKAEIEAADQALQGVREEATQGQRTVLDVLDADQDVIDARIALARARRNEVVAKYSLAASLGLLQPQSLGVIEDSSGQ